MANNRVLAAARDDLLSYCIALMPRFEAAPHHRYLIERLEAVAAGDCDRLIVQMPPRHGKTTITSGLFPSWHLGKFPDRNIIAVSYGQELANDYGRIGLVRRCSSGPAQHAAETA